MQRITKRSIRFIMCFVMMLIAPVICANAETVNNEKQETPIEVSELHLNKKSFKSGSSVEYSFIIKDTGIDEFLDAEGGCFDENEFVDQYGEPPRYYGKDTVYLYWKSTKKQYIVQAYNWKKSDKAKGQLKISGKIPVKKGMKTGTWKLAAIYFEYEGEEFYVKDSRETKYESSATLDLSAMDFKVSGTGKADNKAPVLDLQSLKLSRTSVGKNQKSTFSLKVKDSSKIEEVVCIWDVYDKTNKGSVGDYYNISRMKYNKKTKRYQSSLKLDTSCESKAQLVGIEVRDTYGNAKSYYAYKYNTKTGAYTKKVSKYYNAYKKMTISKK